MDACFRVRFALLCNLYLMKKLSRKVQEILSNKSLMKKLYWTLGILALYRLLTFIPVPFVNIETLMTGTLEAGAAGGFGYLIMLMGGALGNFAMISI
jgi:preprotein translocase subunit SecY